MSTLITRFENNSVKIQGKSRFYGGSGDSFIAEGSSDGLTVTIYKIGVEVPILLTRYDDILDGNTNNPIGATLNDTIENIARYYFFKNGGSISGDVTADDVSPTANHRVLTTEEGVAIGIHGLTAKTVAPDNVDEIGIWDSLTSSVRKMTISVLRIFKSSPKFEFLMNTVDKMLISKANTQLIEGVEITDTGVPAANSFLVGDGVNFVQKTLTEVLVILGVYPLTYFSSTASKVITDQLENTMFGAGVGSTTIQVTNTPVIVGSRIKIRITGIVTTAANAGNSTMKIKVGGITIVTSTIALTNNLSNVPFDIDFVFSFRTVGASATVIGNGISQIYNGANGVLVRPLSMTTVSSSFSTLSAFVVDVTLQLANTGNSITVTNAAITIER